MKDKLEKRLFKRDMPNEQRNSLDSLSCEVDKNIFEFD